MWIAQTTQNSSLLQTSERWTEAARRTPQSHSHDDRPHLRHLQRAQASAQYTRAYRLASHR